MRVSRLPGPQHEALGTVAGQSPEAELERDPGVELDRVRERLGKVAPRMGFGESQTDLFENRVGLVDPEVLQSLQPDVEGDEVVVRGVVNVALDPLVLRVPGVVRVSATDQFAEDRSLPPSRGVALPQKLPRRPEPLAVGLEGELVGEESFVGVEELGPLGRHPVHAVQ